MALWGKNDASSNTPKFKVMNEVSANGANAYGNVTPGAFNAGQAVGVFGVDDAEVHAHGKGFSPGWMLIRQGTGPLTGLAINAVGASYGNLGVGVVSNGISNASFTIGTNATGNVTSVTLGVGGSGFINAAALTYTLPANAVYDLTISVGGSGYANGEAVKFSNGAVNAAANLVTNSTGGITSVVFTTGGRGFPSNTGTVVTVTTVAGTGATLVAKVALGSGLTLVPTLGGRAGRIQNELLVAVSSMTGDGSDDAILPDS